MGKIRGTHSSPGVYTNITDLSYAANSLGITTLGLVGETKKGPAFEPVAISDWNMYQDYFGGTSPEKFRDSLMPKYELPYIAKSYLSASDQLYVCRVLGLSGYNAGPAWAIYGSTKGDENADKYLIAVLRSRGSYNKYGSEYDKCSGVGGEYDTLTYFCDEVDMVTYTDAWVEMNCMNNTTETIKNNGEVAPGNYGKFGLKCNNIDKPYMVSLNPSDKDYIYNVLGSEANNGSTSIFVEALYDIELQKLVNTGVINQLYITKFEAESINSICEPVSDFLYIPSNKLTRKDLGKTFLYKSDRILLNNEYHFIDKNGVPTDMSADNDGAVFQVSTMIDKTNTKVYVYKELLNNNNEAVLLEYNNNKKIVNAVKVLSEGVFYHKNENGVVDVLTSVNNYREQFRHAVTPWFVSELKGDANNIELNKLFRFHTISDGNMANTEVKITIANIRPDEGTFDVLIRDFNDSDGNQIILESYRGLDMVPGSSKYIGLKIGTINGDFERKSKYVMVEIADNEAIENSVPCGFLGYPVGSYGDIKTPSFTYNTIYDADVNANKQCFGISNITGIDADILAYKGYDAENGNYNTNYTNGFHLDSNIEVLNANIYVDGQNISGWTGVNQNNDSNGNYIPTIGSESQMEGTIYENVKLRKFTACFYGGFDGWDIYRGSRTNTDEYRANKYKGLISNGFGSTFNKIQDGEGLNLDTNAITSDYYAYLAGYKQFENTEKYVINLFATPGIDYVNQKLLTDDVLELIENRQDSFYVMTTPDKPFGASESIDEMYSPSNVVGNLEDSNIDTYYASTYYPWVRYYDAANSMYISLPVTKDVLRNMANVDNKKYPWYAPAGIERGSVDCARARIYTKIEDEDTVYDGRINPVKTFSVDGVKIWGNKTLYSQDTPMNRINTVRLVLYMRKLISEASRILIFEPNDTTLKNQFDGIIRPILNQIKADRGITDFKLIVNQTPEQMDAHEISAKLFVKPVPSLEYVEIDFVVTPQGVEWDE